MAECEICGAPHAGQFAEIEKAVLTVCPKCAKLGVEIAAAESVRKPEKSQAIEQDLAEDYPTRITKARESRGLSRDQLAFGIKEKLSVIKRIEDGHLDPDLQTAKKIEKFLGITLMESLRGSVTTKTRSGQKATIGDVVVVKKKS